VNETPVPVDSTDAAAGVSNGKSSPVMDVGRELMALNWLTAGYSHRDWLGEWANVVLPRREASLRLLMHASRVQIERFGLRERYLRDVGDHGWLLVPHAKMAHAAETLAVAMLGGWVRHRLERQQVALQQRVLGSDRRARALEYSGRLRALPFPPGGQWPVPVEGPPSLFRLGVCALAGMLENETTGAQQRFVMRFAKDTVVPLPLTPAQRDEALAVIQSAALDSPPSSGQSFR